MKLINQITFKSDCVEFFLRWLVKEKGLGELAIIDCVCQPNKFQELFDEFRRVEYNDHPMDRPNKIGKVKDLVEDECYHENVEHQKAEYDTNVPEAYFCKDCGEDLEEPFEPDWDLLAKEERI